MFLKTYSVLNIYSFFKKNMYNLLLLIFREGTHVIDVNILHMWGSYPVSIQEDVPTYFNVLSVWNMEWHNGVFSKEKLLVKSCVFFLFSSTPKKTPKLSYLATVASLQ